MDKYVLHDGEIVYYISDSKEEIMEEYKIFRKTYNLEPLKIGILNVTEEGMKEYEENGVLRID